MDFKKKAQNAVNITINALKVGSQSLSSDFENIIKIIKERTPPGKLVVMGMGKSGHIGAKLAATFASTGTPSFFVHPGEAGHGDLGMLSEQDIVLAISQSGSSEEILKVLPFIFRHKIPLISMTGNIQSVLAKNSTYLIDTAVEKEACPLDLAPTASTSLTLALGDALAVCLLEYRGFTKDDFAHTHPLGALGKKLVLTVSDIMSDLSDTASITEEHTIKEAVIEITKSGLGFATIVNNENIPIGVFTDGDIRRCLDKDTNINTTKIKNIMTTSFVSISNKELAIKAVNLMSENKVSGLPVISEKNELVGSINMRQLLQAGVI